MEIEISPKGYLYIVPQSAHITKIFSYDLRGLGFFEAWDIHSYVVELSDEDRFKGFFEFSRDFKCSVNYLRHLISVFPNSPINIVDCRDSDSASRQDGLELSSDRSESEMVIYLLTLPTCDKHATDDNGHNIMYLCCKFTRWNTAASICPRFSRNTHPDKFLIKALKDNADSIVISHLISNGCVCSDRSHDRYNDLYRKYLLKTISEIILSSPHCIFSQIWSVVDLTNYMIAFA